MQANEQIGLLLKVIHDAISMTANSQLKEFDLTFTQMQVLFFLNNKGGEDISQKDIEQYFHVKHTTVIGLLRRLESKGFVTTFTNSQDKRVRNVEITEKGKAVQETIGDQRSELEAKLVKGLSLKQIQELKAMLNVLYDNIK